jgi:hypothetical protein
MVSEFEQHASGIRYFSVTSSPCQPSAHVLVHSTCVDKTILLRTCSHAIKVCFPPPSRLRMTHCHDANFYSNTSVAATESIKTYSKREGWASAGTSPNSQPRNLFIHCHVKRRGMPRQHRFAAPPISMNRHGAFSCILQGLLLSQSLPITSQLGNHQMMV